MKFAVLAPLLFIFAQPLSPLPMQSIDKQTQKPNQEATVDNKGNSPTDPAIPKGIGTGSETTSNNTHNLAHEAATEPPKQSEPWSRADKLAAIYDGLTALLVIVGGVGICFGIRTLAAIKSQTELMRKNIVLQFRPRLIVRRVDLEYGSIEVGGRPAKVHCTIANIGGTEGRITRATGAFGYADVPGFWGNPSRGQRMTPDAFIQEIDMPLSLNFKAGEDQQVTIEVVPAMFEKIRFVQARSNHHVTNPKIVGEVRISAEIQYADDTGINRKTGFCRWLDIESMRFKPVDDSEYEYAD